MSQEQFPKGVSEKLHFYVYRLVDPRNAETFYVGKGYGNRVFQHALGALKFDSVSFEEEDAEDAKIQRIREIQHAGLAVLPLIHMHGIEDEKQAYMVEAALIDAYPGLTNKVSGHGSDTFSVAHVEQIIAAYAAEPLVAKHKLLLINVGRSYEKEGRELYEAVRAAWRINVEKARAVDFILAHSSGIVRGVFVAEQWMKAIPENFPGRPNMNPNSKRWGFVGRLADKEIHELYCGKFVPPAPRGAISPIRYIG
jgi:hypothetical protein